jgi:hypothetical protein
VAEARAWSPARTGAAVVVGSTGRDETAEADLVVEAWAAGLRRPRGWRTLDRRTIRDGHKVRRLRELLVAGSRGCMAR